MGETRGALFSRVVRLPLLEEGIEVIVFQVGIGCFGSVVGHLEVVGVRNSIGFLDFLPGVRHGQTEADQREKADDKSVELLHFVFERDDLRDMGESKCKQ